MFQDLAQTVFMLVPIESKGYMKIKVILNLLLTYYLCLVAQELKKRVIPMEIKMSLKNVPMPCHDNIKYYLLSSLKVNR